MTITIPSGRTIALAAKDGGGFQSEGISEVSPGTEIITGSGFGTGPTVVLFDSFDSGEDGSLISLSGAEIGGWSDENTGVSEFVSGTRYFLANGRLWMAGRDTTQLSADSKNGTGLRFDFAEEVTEFRLSYRVLCPSGYKFPGCASANTNYFTGSNWKITWWGRAEEGSASGAGAGEPDICIPTVSNGNGSGSNEVQVLGNHFRWEYGASSRVYVGSPHGSNENFWSFYQSPESSEGDRDGVVEYLQGNGVSTSRTIRTSADPFHEWNGDVTNETFNMFLFNGWMGLSNSPPEIDYVNVLPLFADAYVAVGPNSRACILTSDAPTVSGSTDIYIVPPTTWTDTEVTFNPKARESLAYRHLVLADGTLLEDV